MWKGTTEILLKLILLIKAVNNNIFTLNPSKALSCRLLSCVMIIIKCFILKLYSYKQKRKKNNYFLV